MDRIEVEKRGVVHDFTRFLCGLFWAFSEFLVSKKFSLGANIIGQAITAILGFLFIPMYIKYLGVEAYGLVGIYAVLQTCFSLVDLGISPTMTREMARFSSGSLSKKELGHLVRSVEWLGLVLAGIGTLVVVLGADFLAKSWINGSSLDPEVISKCFMLMGLVLGGRFMESIYRASLLGLEQFVLANTLGVSISVLKNVGILLVLQFLSNDVVTFFIWQVAIGLIGAVGSLIAFRIVVAFEKGDLKFSVDAIKSRWKFATGMVGITATMLLLTQTDKILMSNMLRLEEFSYYSLASTLAAVLTMVLSPIAQTIYPSLVRDYQRDQGRAFIARYHDSCQLVVGLTTAVGLSLVFFGHEIILLWSGNPKLVDGVAPIASILVIGTIANTLMTVPYQAMLASGWTSLTLVMNVLLVCLVVPLLLFLVPLFGPIAAAWVWVGVNASYLLITVQIMHTRLLRGEKKSWYLRDTLALLVPQLAFFFFAWLAARMFPSNLVVKVFFLAAAIVASYLSMLYLSLPGKQLLLRLRDYRGLKRNGT